MIRQLGGSGRICSCLWVLGPSPRRNIVLEEVHGAVHPLSPFASIFASYSVKTYRRPLSRYCGPMKRHISIPIALVDYRPIFSTTSIILLLDLTAKCSGVCPKSAFALICAPLSQYQSHHSFVSFFYRRMQRRGFRNRPLTNYPPPRFNFLRDSPMQFRFSWQVFRLEFCSIFQRDRHRCLIASLPYF